MARPLRLEFAGAVYHVTSRGDQREDIFIAKHFSVHYMTVSRAVRKWELGFELNVGLLELTLISQEMKRNGQKPSTC